MRSHPRSSGFAALALPLVLLAAIAMHAEARAARVEGPGAPPNDAALIARGRELALIGNCAICHGTEDGKSFAGGRPFETPFGVVYSTNITPDAETGIGRWSPDDFRRAMRDGVGPDGRHYYPVFPYDHYTRLDVADVDAIHAYLRSREPVRATPPANALQFPYNIRATIAAWKALYFRAGAIVPDRSQTDVWNRGRYLVEALAHCGACHTPRNALGAEVRDRDLAGGFAQGWHAPALDSSSPAPTPWSVDSLVTYLRSGYDASHGASRGPMAPITRALAEVPESEVRAIATYVATNIGTGAAAGPAAAAKLASPHDEEPLVHDEHPGTSDVPMRELFAGACAGCHGGQRGVRLEHSTAVTDVTPANLVRVIYDGLAPIEGEPARAMPGFRGTFTEAQAAALVRYIRARFSARAPWPDVEGEVMRVARRSDQGGRR